MNTIEFFAFLLSIPISLTFTRSFICVSSHTGREEIEKAISHLLPKLKTKPNK